MIKTKITNNIKIFFNKQINFKLNKIVKLTIKNITIFTKKQK